MSGGQVSEPLIERMMEVIHTMEDLNPRVYDSCSSKLKITMSSDDQVKWTYEKITSQLLSTGVTWGNNSHLISPLLTVGVVIITRPRHNESLITSIFTTIGLFTGR